MKELGIFLGEERLGLVRVESVRGKEVFAFAYDGAWLKSGNVPTIDPDVVASAGEQFPVGKEMFGFLADIAPDRWGRRLIRRKEVQLARRRRGITSALMAERADMSLMTLRAIERGSPKVAMGNYMSVLFCLGMQGDMAQVAAADQQGRDIQDARLLRGSRQGGSRRLT